MFTYFLYTLMLFGLQGDPTSPFWRRSALGFLWKEWCSSWNSSTLATSCEELTHWKRPWCWEGLGAGGEGDNRAWDGWMASPTRWTWVWVNSGSWWWMGRPGVLWFMGLQRVGHDWVTELNWTDHIFFIHPSTDGHLGCWHVLTVVNSATMNTGMQVSFWTIVCRYMPRSGILGLYGNSIFTFLSAFILFLIVTTYVHSHRQCRRGPFSHTLLQHLLFVTNGQWWPFWLLWSGTLL